MSQQAAGLDLYNVDAITIEPHKSVLVDTGIQVEIPSHCYGRIAPKSGLAVKHCIDVGAGVMRITKEMSRSCYSTLVKRSTMYRREKR